jgi:Leucine-rich repeat (LRR) protein
MNDNNENIINYNNSKENNNDSNNKIDEEQENNNEEVSNKEENNELTQFIYINKQLENIEQLEQLYENPEELNSLILSNNLIKEIPNSFIYFTSLYELDLSNNKIENIKNIKACKNLEVLILSNNSIKFLNDNLYGLKNIVHLDLSHNKIYINSSLIKTFSYNNLLKSLCLEGNLNYHFETVKYQCIDYLSSLEFLDHKTIINKQNKKQYNQPIVYIQTITGDVKPIRRIKEYIKLRQSDINENEKIYDQVFSERVMSLRSLSEEYNSNNSSTYYFHNSKIYR